MAATRSTDLSTPLNHPIDRWFRRTRSFHQPSLNRSRFSRRLALTGLPVAPEADNCVGNPRERSRNGPRYFALYRFQSLSRRIRDKPPPHLRATQSKIFTTSRKSQSAKKDWQAVKIRRATNGRKKSLARAAFQLAAFQLTGPKRESCELRQGRSETVEEPTKKAPCEIRKVPSEWRITESRLASRKSLILNGLRNLRNPKSDTKSAISDTG